MKRRWLLWVTAGLWPLALALTWLQVRASRATAGAGPPSSASTSVNLAFVDLSERVRGRQGELLWRFEAGQVEVQAGGDYWLYGLRRAEVLREQEPDLTLKADRARLDQRTQNLALAGHVEASSRSGAKLWAQTAFWFEEADRQSRLVVPELDRLEYRAPDAPPDEPAAELHGARLIFWPADERLDLPEGLTLTRGEDKVSAAAGSALVGRSEVQLSGPATVDTRVPNPDDRQAKPTHVVLSVASGGQLAYDHRSGAARVTGGATVDLPEDAARVQCATASFSGRPHRRLEASGSVQVAAPDDQLTAGQVSVALGSKTAEFSQAVRLVHRTPAGSTALEAPRLVYHYPKRGRRAEADGGTRLATGDVSTQSRSLAVDLERETAVLSGAVRLVTHERGQSVSLEAGRVVHVFHAGHRHAEATGGAHLDTGEATARSERLSVDLERETAVLTGAVQLTTRPTPAPPGAGERDQARHRPITIWADKLVHRYKAGERRTEANGGSPRFAQGDRQGSAQQLAFNHEREFAWLNGNVRLWNRQGERAHCGTLAYDLKKDEMQVNRPVEALFFLDEQE